MIVLQNNTTRAQLETHLSKVENYLSLSGCLDGLRDYQVDACVQIIESFLHGVKSTLLQAPTAAGKTVILSSIAQCFIKRSEPVLVLAHAEELVLQAQAKLQATCGISVGIIKAGYPADPDALIQVASIQTLARRQLWFTPKLIIIDEAHHAVSNTYQSVLNRCPNAFRLGVTATPQRLDGKGLHSIFEALIQAPSVKELIDAGYLSKFKLYAAKKAVSTKGIKTHCGDYSQAQLAEAAKEPDILGDIVPTFLQYAARLQTMVYCINRDHLFSVLELYPAAGISVDYVLGDTSAGARKRIIQAFRDGRTQVLLNVGIATEGFDVPGLECVQILRPTQSLGLYLQMVGRSLRIAPGKSHAVILDHTRNWVRHGLPSDDRVWSLDGHAETKDNPKRLTISEDGEVIEKDELIHDETALLSEITPDDIPVSDPILDRLDRLLEQQRQRHYKKGWVAYKFMELKGITHDHLRECAKRLNYHWKWADRKWDEYRQGGVA